MSATQAATPTTMPTRRRRAPFRGTPEPSSIQRSLSSGGCPAPCADVPSSMEAPPLVDSRSTVAFHPPCTRVPGESYRRCEHPSRGRIRIRKIRYGVTDQGEIDPAGAQESGPPCRLEQNPGGRPRLRRVLSEAGLEHAGQLVDVPELQCPRRPRAHGGRAGPPSRPRPGRPGWTEGSAERQRRPRSVSATWPDRPATSPKSLALASRLRKAPLRTPL